MTQIAPPPLRAHGSFLYTPEDLVEGLSVDLTSSPRRQRSGGTWRTIGICLMFPAIFGLWLLLHTYSVAIPSTPSPATAPPEPEAAIDVSLALGPSLVASAFVVIILLVFVMTAKTAQKSPPERRAQRARLALVLGMILAGVFIWGALTILANPIEIDWHPDRAILMMMALAPWIMLFIFVILWSMRFQQTRARRVFAERSSYKMERSVQLDDEAVRVSFENADLKYRWAYFKSAIETASQVILLDEAGLAHIYPKRAFTATGTLDLALALIRMHVIDSRLLDVPRGFAVAPQPVLSVASQ